MSFIHAETAQLMSLLRERTAYKRMTFTMQSALERIVEQPYNASAIATEVLDQLHKEYGNGFVEAGQHQH